MTIAHSAATIHRVTTLLRVHHTIALHRVLRHIATAHHSAAARAVVAAAIQAVAVTLVVAAVAAAHAAEVREAVSREFKIQDSKLPSGWNRLSLSFGLENKKQTVIPHFFIGEGRRR